MKTSTQALMLAILMGMLAWVLDAVISWHFFPGRPFLDMLWMYDPGRTLYVRSTVVILFFLFGLISGRLISRLEKLNQQISESMRLQRGVRELHELIVQSADSDALSRQALPCIRKAFELEALLFCRLTPRAREEFTCVSTLDPQETERIKQSLSPRLPEYKKLTALDFSPACGSTDDFVAPIRQGDRLFGFLYGRRPAGRPEPADGFSANFLSICNDLGHGLAHLQDARLLRESLDKLEELYQTAPVGIFTSTPDGRLRFANRAMATLVGAQKVEDVLGDAQPLDQYYLEPGRREQFVLALRRQGEVSDFAIDLRGRDGKIRNSLFAARLKMGSEGEELIQGFAMDMTRSRSTERENRILQQQLNQARHFKSITVLAGGVAHEFNNILQAMMGSAYLAQLKTGTKSEIWEYLRDIQESGKRAARLCDQMLSYAGKKSMILKMESPDACLRSMLNILRSEMGARMRILDSLSAPHAKVRMDIPSFSEVVNQLVTNAMESQYQEGSAVRIESSVESINQRGFDAYHLTRNLEEETYWVMRVIDQGKGIPPENMEHIFEPFFTTKFQGRGLGLPAVAGLVEKFDGAIGVKSDPKSGSEFAVFLPLAETVLVEGEDETEHGSKAHGSATYGQGTIWVVDDEPLICMTIERLLHRAGFSVRTASNGLDALNQLREGGVDEVVCIILDVTMPRMGGLETLQHIREFAPKLPVLVMSGFDESDSLDPFKNLRVAGFIHKPFRMEQLESRLKKILQDPQS